MRGDRDRRSQAGAPAFTAALDTGQPLLELPDDALRLLAGSLSSVGPLRERVQELQERVVVDPLVGRQGLHVPAHELTQGTLDEALEAATSFAFGCDRPEALCEGARGREVGTAGIPVDGAPAKLLTEALEEVCDVDLRRGNACRRRIFCFRAGHSKNCTGCVCQWSARTYCQACASPSSRIATRMSA